MPQQSITARLYCQKNIKIAGSFALANSALPMIPASVHVDMTEFINTAKDERVDTRQLGFSGSVSFPDVLARLSAAFVVEQVK